MTGVDGMADFGFGMISVTSFQYAIKRTVLDH